VSLLTFDEVILESSTSQGIEGLYSDGAIWV